MTAATDELADRALEVASTPELKRDALDPFGDGPATLLDALNEVLRGYMEGERDDYHLLAEHHAEWALTLDEEGDVVLSCHRDGLKTSTILAYLCLRLEYDPGFQAIWATNNQTVAKSKADLEFNKMVERNPWLLSLQEEERRRSTQTTKAFGNGSSLRASWLDGGIDGERAHLLVLDDLIKARGDGKPEDVREWIEGTATPMVKDDGRTAIVGTRKRPDDIYQHYRDLEAYEAVEYPAVLDYWETAHADDADVDDRRPPLDHYTEVPDPWGEGSIRVLWPEARGPEWLRQKRAEMADFRFFREYCLSFIGGSGNLVDEADINRLSVDGGCSIRSREPPREYRASEGEAVVVAHDPAASPTGDLAAYVAILVRSDGKREVLEATAQQGPMPSTVKSTLADLDRRFDPALVVVESNAMQQYVAMDAVEFSPSLRAKVTPIPTTGEKHSWENGIPRLQRLAEGGSILFYRGHSGTEDLITAILSLELDGGRLEGHTPDLVAAWYMAEQGIRELEATGALDPEPEDDEGDSSGGMSFL